MRIKHILKAIDGTEDFPDDMRGAEFVLTGALYVVFSTLMLVTVWWAYVVCWALWG